MHIERSNFRFLPSEEARLILGYLQALGLNKTADCFLNESPSLSEYRSLGKNRISGLHLLGLNLENIFDHYYQTNYGEEKMDKSVVEIKFSKSVQTDISNDSICEDESQRKCLINNSTQTWEADTFTVYTQTNHLENTDNAFTQTSHVEITENPPEDYSKQNPRKGSNWPNFGNNSDIGHPLFGFGSSYERGLPNWNTSTIRDPKLNDISNYLENTDTFDFSFRSGTGLAGSKRKSSQPRKSMIFTEELSNSGDFPCFEGDMTAPIELCVDDFLSTVGNDTILNNILELRNGDENPVSSPLEPQVPSERQSKGTRPGFASPKPSPVNPRRISLLECTPSPNKRSNQTHRTYKKNRSTPGSSVLSFNVSVTDPDSRRSNIPLPFELPSNVPDSSPTPATRNVNTTSNRPRNFGSRKRQTPYQKRPPKRKANNSEEPTPSETQEFCNNPMEDIENDGTDNF